MQHHTIFTGLSRIRVYYYLEEGNLNKWLELADECAQKASNYLYLARANWLLATLYAADCKSEAALKTMKKASNNYKQIPDSQQELLDQVTKLLAEGFILLPDNKSAARDYFMQGKELLNQLPPHSYTIEEVWALLDLASVLVNSQDKEQWMEAKRYYEQALSVLDSLYKEHIYKSFYVKSALYGLINICVKFNDEEKTSYYKNYLGNILEKSQDKLAYHLQAILFLKEKRPDQALECVERAIKSDKDTVDLLIVKVLALRQLEKYCAAGTVILSV